MADKNSELHDILDKGVDYKHRRVYFGNKDNEGAFTWESVEDTVRALHKLSADHPKRPIELHMCSEGGDTYQMLRLYDAIQKCSCQIKFFGSGEICSSAVWIMAGCDERWLDPHTSVMIHAGYTSGGEQTYTDSQIDNEEYQKLMDKMMNLLDCNSRMPKEFWEEISQRDTYVTADEAIMLGLADKITEPKKRGNLRKTRAHALRQAPEKRELNKLIKSIYKRIHKGRQLNKIELHIPQEEFDKNIIVDDTPIIEEVVVQPVIKNTLNNSEETNKDVQQVSNESKPPTDPM